MCFYMEQCGKENYCNGNGQCICNDHVYGADCSYKPTKFYKDEDQTLTKSTTGSKWIYAYHQVVYIPPRDGEVDELAKGTDTEYKSMEFAITSSKAPISVFI
mmetsp:Transcript_8502/g.13060  ORF Transcript_8502/g.13060 Transcript_8502/m.13060 type:complete len:102 (+) Transcript_8502:1391-1696(+)